MTFYQLELDLDSVKVNQRARYLDQRSFRLKFNVRVYTDRHTIALGGSLKWLVKIIVNALSKRCAPCMSSGLLNLAHSVRDLRAVHTRRGYALDSLAAAISR